VSETVTVSTEHADRHLIMPMTTGDQFSTADVHLAAWLGYIITLAGGSTASDDGLAAIGKLEKHVGGGLALPRIAAKTAATDSTPKASEGPAPATTTKLGQFWDAMKERTSWKVLDAGLISM
jgi:hypothetical protein